MVKGHYHAGKKHGEWTRFHDNGSVHIEAIYASGKPHQTWKYFYPNGNEIATISFVSGVGNGLWQSFYGNGVVSKLQLFRNKLNVEERDYYSKLDTSRKIIMASKTQIEYKNGDPLISKSSFMITDL